MKTQAPPIRQGDVLIIPAGTPRFDGSPTPKSVPTNVTISARDGHGRLVLAAGEVTGHHHAILDREVELFVAADLEEMSDRFLKVEKDATVIHEEHAPLVIPRGDHLVRIKREYQPEAPRYVAD